MVIGRKIPLALAGMALLMAALACGAPRGAASPEAVARRISVAPGEKEPLMSLASRPVDGNTTVVAFHLLEEADLTYGYTVAKREPSGWFGQETGGTSSAGPSQAKMILSGNVLQNEAGKAFLYGVLLDESIQIIQITFSNGQTMQEFPPNEVMLTLVNLDVPVCHLAFLTGSGEILDEFHLQEAFTSERFVIVDPAIERAVNSSCPQD